MSEITKLKTLNGWQKQNQKNNGISECWYKCFLFSVLWHNCFTSQCHEMSLWSSATWPTLLIQSRGKYSKGIVANPSSSPPVLFVPATGLWGREQTADAWPASAVRQQTPPGSHHQLKPPDRLMVCQGMKSATFSATGCPDAYRLLYYGKYGTVYFAPYTWPGLTELKIVILCIIFEIQIHGNSAASLRCLKLR